MEIILHPDLKWQMSHIIQKTSQFRYLYEGMYYKNNFKIINIQNPVLIYCIKKVCATQIIQLQWTVLFALEMIKSGAHIPCGHKNTRNTRVIEFSP